MIRYFEEGETFTWLRGPGTLRRRAGHSPENAQGEPQKRKQTGDDRQRYPHRQKNFVKVLFCSIWSRSMWKKRVRYSCIRRMSSVFTAECWMKKIKDLLPW